MKSGSLCLLCKGSRNLCGNKTCPLLANYAMKLQMKNSVGTDFFGPCTSLFVGRSGYPNVFIGPVAAIDPETAPVADQPDAWFGQDYSKVIELRSMLLRSKYRQGIRSYSRFVEDNRLLAMAERPTDVEMMFKSKPSMDMRFSDVVQPMGPSAMLDRMTVTENIKIDRRVEYIVSDNLKAAEASIKLYENNQDIYKITNILSSGALGKDKKMVPTRWSITAVDDMIFKEVVKKVKDYPSVGEFLVYSSKYLDNHFEILLMPGNWEFENFEAWAPGSIWAQSAKEIQIVEEYEPYHGRKKYAEKQAGGYYAARLGIAEGLNEMKRQARIVSFREISEGYTIPMGVWVVRETVRNAFKNPPEKFASLDSALRHIRMKLKIPLKNYRIQSRILQQRTIFDF